MVLTSLCFKKNSVLQPRLWVEYMYHTPRRTRLLIPQICLSIVRKTVSDAELSPKVEILCSERLLLPGVFCSTRDLMIHWPGNKHNFE